MKNAQTILIVEDDPTARTIYRAYFASMQFKQVLEAANGRQAVRQIDGLEQPPDLIVLDVHMPEMDGTELMRHLRSTGFCGRLVIASGANKSVRDSARALADVYQLDVAGEVAKPLTKRGLDAVFNT